MGILLAVTARTVQCACKVWKASSKNTKLAMPNAKAEGWNLAWTISNGVFTFDNNH